MCIIIICVTNIFQSTLSMRRATIVLSHQIIKITISIHALHEESDGASAAGRHVHHNFNPRSP